MSKSRLKRIQEIVDRLPVLEPVDDEPVTCVIVHEGERRLEFSTMEEALDACPWIMTENCIGVTVPE